VKVLFYHLMPFALAHGGQQIQICQTRDALAQLGVEVDFLQWSELERKGDILHFFGRVPTYLLLQAQQKGMKVVVADLLAAQGARPVWRLKLQALSTRIMERTLPAAAVATWGWESYRLADACVALTSWEAHLMHRLFGAPTAKTHVIPNGVEEVFLQSRPGTRGSWLLCVATITQVKRLIELAQAAVCAGVPVRFIGKPYFESDPYARTFSDLVRAHPKILQHEGPIEDRALLANAYREARGFVLLSAHESMSLSALEAAACGCPLLLSQLPWATTVFGENACYCPITSSTQRTAVYLRQFYDAAPNMKAPPQPLPWHAVARKLKGLYESLLKASP
jgi:glycosyltransferase involved in cell wall biosynthesis